MPCEAWDDTEDEGLWESIRGPPPGQILGQRDAHKACYKDQLLCAWGDPERCQATWLRGLAAPRRAS